MQKKLISVKVGSSSLTHPDGSIDPVRIEAIVDQLAGIKAAGFDVMLITSGAIAAGYSRLGYEKRPSSVPAKQASAAVGQGILMEEYSRFFSAHGLVIAQILLTRGDFSDRRRYKNAFNAIEVILKRNAVPVINENDTVAVDELRVGDNDTLSAQVAAMMHSDLLVILTDTDGLYTADPRRDPLAKRVDFVARITPEIMELGGGEGSKVGVGGMATKLSAAKLATSAGVPVVIGSSREAGVIQRAVDGEAVGTRFAARDTSMKTRLQWMAFYAEASGDIYIDEGAKQALIEHGKSLLPSGIVAIEGDFHAGDIVRVFLKGSSEALGRGRVNLDRDELAPLIGLHREGLEALGLKAKPEVINRENWVKEV